MQQAPVAPPARSQYPAVRRLDGSPIKLCNYLHTSHSEKPSEGRRRRRKILGIWDDISINLPNSDVTNDKMFEYSRMPMN